MKEILSQKDDGRRKNVEEREKKRIDRKRDES